MGRSSHFEASGEREEREEFARLYRKHADELFGFCLRRTRNRAAAEEALGTVFLECWRRRREVDFTTQPLQPWLYGVARNVLRNQRRTQRRQEDTVRTLGDLQRRYAEDPSDEFARQQATSALIGSLVELPAEQREVVNLCVFGGRSYQAAALDLQIPIGTVRSRLNRARLNLAHAVDGS